jgi:hypothetical protein
MTPRSSYRPEVKHQRAMTARLESLATRLEATEKRQRQLERTIDGLARETGLSVSYPCTRCNRCYLLSKCGLLYCPECGYKRSL